MKQTDVDLLNALIGANYNGNKTKFCIAIGMSPQNLNYHIRNARVAKGVLSEDLKRHLADKKIDINQYRRQPTNDFVEDVKMYEIQPDVVHQVAEPEGIFIPKERLLFLLENQMDVIQSQQGTISSQQKTIHHYAMEIPVKKRHSRTA